MPILDPRLQFRNARLRSALLVCQNWVTSQALRDPDAIAPPLAAIRKGCQDALAQGAKVVVSTYNEPLITSEWAVAVFRQARRQAWQTAFVSNGTELRKSSSISSVDRSLQVDLKSFDDRHYRELGGRLQPILDTIRSLHRMASGSRSSPCSFRLQRQRRGTPPADRISSRRLADIPWHVTAFHQDYKMTSPADTRPEDLLRAAAIGRESGLRYIYAGNLSGQVKGLEDTHCHQCGALLIQRHGYSIEKYNLTPQGGCPSCHAPVPAAGRRNLTAKLRPRLSPPQGRRNWLKSSRDPNRHSCARQERQ